MHVSICGEDKQRRAFPQDFIPAIVCGFLCFTSLDSTESPLLSTYVRASCCKQDLHNKARTSDHVLASPWLKGPLPFPPSYPSSLDPADRRSAVYRPMPSKMSSNVDLRGCFHLPSELSDDSCGDSGEGKACGHPDSEARIRAMTRRQAHILEDPVVPRCHGKATTRDPEGLDHFHRRGVVQHTVDQALLNEVAITLRYPGPDDHDEFHDILRSQLLERGVHGNAELRQIHHTLNHVRRADSYPHPKKVRLQSATP